MRSHMRMLALVGLVLAVPAAIHGEPDKADLARIARLIDQLGDDEFARREAASKALEKIGDPALGLLREAASSSVELEIRRRASRLHQAISARLHLFTVEGHSDLVLGVAFSPDGKWVISSGGGTVRLAEAKTGKLIRQMAHPAARSVAFSPDGKRAASTGWGGDQTVRLWDLATGKELKRFGPYESSVGEVMFSSDGNRALFGVSYHRTFRSVEIETGKQQTFSGHTDIMSGLALLPDGKKVLSGGHDGTVRLWDSATAKELRCLKGHRGHVYCVAVSRDGKRAASAGQDKVVRLWDLETGKEIRQLTGHTAWIHGLSIAPDGRRLATAGYDRTIRLWDVQTGKELHQFTGHAGNVYTVAFSPDGSHLVSGGEDKTVRAWRVPR